jgi:hypothetical protein
MDTDRFNVSLNMMLTKLDTPTNSNNECLNGGFVWELAARGSHVPSQIHRQLQRHVAGIARTTSHRPRTCIQQSDAYVHSQHVQRQDHAGSASEGV